MAAGRMPRSLRLDLAMILGTALLGTAAVVWFDLDRRIARAVYVAGSALGDLAENAAGLSFLIVTVWLAVFAVAPLRRRWPLVARAGGVFTATLIIAVLALITNLKTELDRPRPDQTVEYGGDVEYRHPFQFGSSCDCRSFPSTAAGFAFVAAAPYFVVRRRRPGLAWSALAVGLAWGSLVGYWRMVSGRHWFSDVLWSGAIVLAVATVLAHLTTTWREEPHRHE